MHKQAHILAISAHGPFLLVSHRLGRMYMRDEVARGYQHKHGYEQSGDVEGEDEEPVHLHGHCVHIIRGWIELHDARSLLQEDEGEGENVAYDETLAYDEGGKPQEGVAHGGVARSKSLEDAYHGGALEDDDEQTADHCHHSHGCHDGKDNPHIEVEKVEPRENLRRELSPSRACCISAGSAAPKTP